jgi:hypothetical protein
VHSIYLESSDWTSAFSVTTGGINLFFDGNTSPGISIHLATSGDKNVPTAWAVTAAGLSTYNVSDSSTLASGSSSYDNGIATVSINPATVNWVGATGVNPYSAGQTVQRLDVTVALDSGSPVPEPGSLALIGAGLLALGVRKFRHA